MFLRHFAATLATLLAFAVSSFATAQESCPVPKDVYRSVVMLRSDVGFGSGWFYGDGKVIVTAAHVAEVMHLQRSDNRVRIEYSPWGVPTKAIVELDLLYMSNAAYVSQDIAVLGLKEDLPGILPLKIAENEPAKLSYGFTAGYADGELTAFPVKVIGITQYQFRGNREPGDVLAFSGLHQNHIYPLIPGSSGSPILDCTGSVVAMMSIIDSIPALRIMTRQVRGKKYSTTTATNFGPLAGEISKAVARAVPLDKVFLEGVEGESK